MRARFTFPTLPLNPLLRALALACSVVVLVGLLTVGLAVGAAVLAVAALVVAIRRWRAGRHPAPRNHPSSKANSRWYRRVRVPGCRTLSEDLIRFRIQ